MDSEFQKFNSQANTADASCLTLVVEGCMDPDYLEFNSAGANTADASCINISSLRVVWILIIQNSILKQILKQESV